MLPKINIFPQFNMLPQFGLEETFPFGFLESRGNGTAQSSLQRVEVSGDVHGPLFRSSIRQEYRNESGETLEVIYTFPLAWDTVLLGLSAEIGGKKLEGRVVGKAVAEKNYEESVSKGDSAVMVQESAEGLYTVNLGNIKAGESMAVAIHCARLLRFEQGRVRLCIPTVISERYGDSHGPGRLAPHESVEVSHTARYPFSLRINLFGEMGRSRVTCPSHTVAIEPVENGCCVTLKEGAALDRDFVLLMEGSSGASQALCVPGEGEYMIVAGFAPTLPQKNVSPLGLKVLVDCSGSMTGGRIAQARQGLERIIKLLSPGDHIAYSRFGSDVRHMTKKLLPCTPEVVEKLTSLVRKTDADMGSTEMEEALTSTFKDIAAPGGHEIPPAVLLITDGDVWAVDEIVRAGKASGHRIFAIGVGAAPAESLLRKMAEQTGGACEFVTPNESMAEAVVRMFHRMRGAIATNVRVQWGEEPLWQSVPPRYLYDGETVHCFAVLKHQPATAPTLSWSTEDGVRAASAGSVEIATDDTLLRLGKARQMRECSSPEERCAIALKYQLVSDRTSLILTHEREEGDKAEGLPKVQHVPQMPAFGHGCYVGICSFLPMRQGFIDPAVYKNRYKGNADMVRADMVRRIVEIWSNGQYQFTTASNEKFAGVCKFLEDVRIETGFDEVWEFLEDVRTETGLSQEQVWAVFMEWALEKIGKGADRHSLRLLRATQAGVTLENANAMRLRFEAWAPSL